jgi:hypothetical protein
MTPVTSDVGDALYRYGCQACGGSATWQPSRRLVACRSCQTAVPLPAADPTPAASFDLVHYLRDSPENRRTFTPVRVERPCPACSHTVVFAAGIMGTACGACLTPLLRPPHESDMPIRPTGVVPFAIDAAAAREDLSRWWRAWRGADPRTRHLQPGPLVARYVPYWQFSVRVSCAWRHTVEDRDGSKRVSQGEVHGDYGESEPATRRLPVDLLRALPFPFAHAIAYDRRYLAGAVVEQYDDDLFQAWTAAHERLDTLVKTLVRKDSGTLLGPDERWPSWSEEKGWLILAPFYTAEIDVRGERHQIVIDGHSGQVASTVPPFVPLWMWLVVTGVLGALGALAWWALAG